MEMAFGNSINKFELTIFIINVVAMIVIPYTKTGLPFPRESYR